MPEAARSKVLGKILDAREDDKAYAKERQHTAQAFSLHVEWMDGRRAEGFAWAHYTGYLWADDGDAERLILIFGARAVEIEGHNLAPIVGEIREGKLNLIREMNSSRRMLLGHSNPAGEPIISAIHTFPDMREILSDIKGEKDDQGRHARRVQR
jgi:hypothetical protein